MRGTRATSTEIISILAMAGQCNYVSCPPDKCICHAQASAVAESFHVIRRANKQKERIGLGKSSYSPEEVATVISMHSEKRSIKHIADATGRSISSVWQKIRTLRADGLLGPAHRVDVEARKEVVMALIKASWDEHGHFPSHSSILRALGLKHKSQATKVLQDLQVEGRIRKTKDGCWVI